MWLDEKLQLNEQITDDGRIFSSEEKFPVMFDIPPNSLQVKVSSDQLALQSKSSFVTVKASCCGVYKGKWMFEVQLHSKVKLKF